MATENQTPEITKWIQTRSWELELLVTGGAIFSLIRLLDFLSIQMLKWDAIIGLPLISIIPGQSIRLLIFYFSIHLITRSYWLSLISLQKLYPQGIRLEKLNYSEPFRSMATRFNLANQTTNIDKFCSALFSMSFTILLIWIGFWISVLVCTVPFFFENETLKVLISVPLLLSLFLFLIDLLSYGVIREPGGFLEIGKFKIYLPIYWFWNTLSLGFIWRTNLQIVSSNVKAKWKLSVLMLASFVLGSFAYSSAGFYLGLVDKRKYPAATVAVDESRYMDRLEPDRWHGTTIQTDVITDNYLKIFVPHNISNDRRIDSLKVKYLSDIIGISINDSSYTQLQWLGITKTNGLKGVVTVIDISSLENKMHLLQVSGVRRGLLDKIVIPFWKQ